ncbi:Ear1 [Kluyveromyces lactis]|nr:Ear1 [Kluyveromyces lactis]
MNLNLVARHGHKSKMAHKHHGDSAHVSERPSDPDVDMDLIVFTMMFMFLSYLLSILVYFVTRWLVKRLFTARISLHEEGTMNGGQSDLSADRYLDDESEVKEFLQNLSPEEQFYYKQGEEYVKQNPPLLVPYLPNDPENREEVIPDPIVNEQTLQFIEEEGAAAWEFQADPNLPNDTVMIQERTELTFLNFSYDASVMTTLPIPRLNKVYYYECKIFELNQGKNHLSDNEMISIGLSTSPYPYFRLPGRHHHSISYDSDGCRRMNSSFPMSAELQTLFPRFEKGDVIGIGYRTRSGTVFFTHNGKKLNEKKVGGHIKGWKLKYLYPIVGSNIPCKIHVNFGTYGFVYIEANVKKWGYSKNAGIKLPPPSYEDYDQDVLLESAFEDDVSDSESITSDSINEQITDQSGNILPPPPGFEFSTSVVSDMPVESITMHSLPAEPPNYSADEDEEHNVEDNTIANQFVATT